MKTLKMASRTAARKVKAYKCIEQETVNQTFKREVFLLNCRSPYAWILIRGHTRNSLSLKK